MSSLHGDGLRKGHWIKMAEALVRGAVHRQFTSTVCICAIKSTTADIVVGVVQQIPLYEMLY